MMKRTTIKEVKAKIFLSLEKEGMIWSKLRKTLDISEATLSRALNDLIEKEIVKKMIINNKVHYVIWKLPAKEKAEVIKDLERARELFIELKKLGLFSKGITDKEILEIMKDSKFKSLIVTFPELDINKLDLLRLVSFLSKATFILTHFLYSGIDVKLKINGNPDEEIKNLDKTIKELKANKSKYF